MQSSQSLTLWFNRVQRIAGAIGVIFLIAALVGAALGPAEFFQAYLLAYFFWLGMALGCLVVAMLHQLSGGMWGAVMIRFLEAGMSTLPVLMVLFAPIIAGMFYLYPWTRADQLLQRQSLYLNIPFFLIRALVYFIVWISIAYFLRRWSLERDVNASPDLTWRLQRFSAIGIVLFGLTATFAVIDWVMSLEPHWYSTIYAAMVIVGAVLGAFAFTVVVVAILDTRAPLSRVVGRGLFNDLGSLLLAFVMIWTYLAFSQFLVIYSGNLIHETPWYIHRLQGGWEWLALAVAVLQFFLPFLFLLFRDVKRNAWLLAPIAALLVFARLGDVFWLIKPAFSPDRLNITWLDFVAPIGIGGIWMAMFVWNLKRKPLLPAHDRRLIEEAAAEVAHERAQ